MQEQLNTSRPKGHHLTAVERGRIAALHAEKKGSKIFGVEGYFNAGSFRPF